MHHVLAGLSAIRKHSPHFKMISGVAGIRLELSKSKVSPLEALNEKLGV